jgi:hypothetical protein
MIKNNYDNLNLGFVKIKDEIYQVSSIDSERFTLKCINPEQIKNFTISYASIRASTVSMNAKNYKETYPYHGGNICGFFYGSFVKGLNIEQKTVDMHFDVFQIFPKEEIDLMFSEDDLTVMKSLKGINKYDL